MAISTARPTRAGLKSTFFYDDREAPKTASRYCKAHGMELAADLVNTLVEVD